MPSGGRPPRGYKVQFEEIEIEGRTRQVRRWVEDPELWALVWRAWEMKLAGMGHRRILEETGLYKSRGCLTTFFRNTIYKGELVFGGTLIEVPALVTEEEWERVQEARRGCRRATQSRSWPAFVRHPRQRASRFLLSGLLKCAHCGAAMCGDSTPERDLPDGHRKEWRFYICSAKKNRRECGASRIGATLLEENVVDYVATQILSVPNLRRYLALLSPLSRDALLGVGFPLPLTRVGSQVLPDAFLWPSLRAITLSVKQRTTCSHDM